MCKCVIVHNMGERVLVDGEISGLVKIGQKTKQTGFTGTEEL